MATAPEHQGKGSCSRLMRTATRYADDHKILSYLEASGERNPNIYRRFGYEVKETASLKHPKEPGASAFNQLHAMVRTFSLSEENK